MPVKHSDCLISKSKIPPRKWLCIRSGGEKGRGEKRGGKKKLLGGRTWAEQGVLVAAGGMGDLSQLQMQWFGQRAEGITYDMRCVQSM